jgi:hypothetical protein
VPPQRIDALPSLAYQRIPRPEYNAICLLLFILYCNKPHARPLCRPADWFGIGRVVLLSLHKRLDIRWRVIPPVWAPSGRGTRAGYRDNATKTLMFRIAIILTHVICNASFRES